MTITFLSLIMVIRLISENSWFRKRTKLKALFLWLMKFFNFFNHKILKYLLFTLKIWMFGQLSEKSINFHTFHLWTFIIREDLPILALLNTTFFVWILLIQIKPKVLKKCRNPNIWRLLIDFLMKYFTLFVSQKVIQH